MSQTQMSASEKRVPSTALPALKAAVSNAASNLEDLLSKDPFSEQDDELKLTRFATHLKSSLSTYLDASSKLVEHLIRIGSRDEAREVRETRMSQRKECHRTIDIINSLRHAAKLDLISNIDITSEVSRANPTQDQGRLETQPSHIDSRAVERDTEDLERQQRILEAQHKANEAKRQYDRKQEQIQQENVAQQLQLRRQSEVRQRDSLVIDEVSPFDSLKGLPALTSNERAASYVAAMAAGVVERPATALCHSAPPTEIVCRSQLSSFFNLPEPAAVPLNRQASAFATAPQASGGATARVRTGGAPISEPYHLPFAMHEGVGPGQLVDASTFHYLRQELMKASDNPFNGEAYKFHSWIQSIKNRMSGLSMNASDIIKILEVNSSGRPQSLIQKYQEAGGPEPRETLQKIWTDLHRYFGSSVQIADELQRKMEQFPQIKSSGQNFRIKELALLCNVIAFNMPHSSDLTIYNLAVGQKTIWMKLPEFLQNKWRKKGQEYELANGRYPPLSILIGFLEQQAAELCNPHYDISALREKSNARVLQTTVGESASKPKCVVHGTDSHPLSECKKFLSLPFSDKRQIAFRHNLCFLCLGEHKQSECKGVTCSKCKKNHHVVMHRDFPSRTFIHSSKAKVSTSSTASDSRNNCTVVCGSKYGSKTCSKTLLVDIEMPAYSSLKLRAYCVLDEQSTSSFIDPKVLEYFNVSFPVESYTLTTLTGYCVQRQGMAVEGIQITGVGQTLSYSLPKVLTSDAIPDTTNEVASPEIVGAHPHVAHLSKYFNPFDHNADVLLLLGLDCDFLFQTRCYGDVPPFAHRTTLGWSLVGGVCPYKEESFPKKPKRALKICVDHEHFSAEQNFSPLPKIQDAKKNVFTTQPDDELSGLSQDDKKFVALISESISVNKNGNITMPLPFKSDGPSLPCNEKAVYHRTFNTLSRLKKDPPKLAQCLDSMNKFITAGHVEKIPVHQLTPEAGKAWWLPVFPVVHSKKGKVRLVFDASAAYLGTSLNNEVLQGPDENNRLKGVLFRFRCGEVGFVADIESMFHSFHLNPEHKDFMRFFWFKDNKPDNNLVQYRARVHIFGCKSSPAIANFGLKYASAHSVAQDFPEAKRYIQQNFYVDDGLGTANSSGEAVKILKDARTILGHFNIRLHKIISSSSDVLREFPLSELADQSHVQLSDTAMQRTLGIAWNVTSDEFVMTAELPERAFTKRGVLSTVGSLFDPLGIASPVVLAGRLIQRALIPSKSETGSENLNCGWDDPLPAAFVATWESWKRSLTNVRLLSVPRSYRPVGFGTSYFQSLHVYADASQVAIGYVICIRSVNDDGKCHIAFVTANSKVAPRGATSIPRLELCAAVEASTAALEVTRELHLRPEHVCLYSDSRIVLGYLTNTIDRFSRYVTRRVSIILNIFPASSWSYVPSESNPADLATKPSDPVSLAQTCWLTGPTSLAELTLLKLPYEPISELPETESESLVLSSVVQTVETVFESICNRNSTWNRVLAVVQKVVNFVFKLRDLSLVRRGVSMPVRDYCVTRCEAAEYVIGSVQRTVLPDLVSNLKSRAPLLRNHKFAKLSPFIDANGLVRVGGRLSNARIPYHLKHPLLIPAAHSVSSLIIRHCHQLANHQGRHITHAFVRDAGYYVQGGSKRVRKVIADCTVCRMLRGPLLQQKMSDLPADRLSVCPPFVNSGVDVFGPYIICAGKGTRKNKSERKMWVLIFTCLVSRAVHLEPLPSLDTASFINGLRRFFAVRGACKRLRSDQGTNFVGAFKTESALSFQEFEEALKTRDIEWQMNPPHASHYGGAWERKIGCIKRAFNAAIVNLGERLLTYDEFITLLQECAAIVNNAPMWGVPDLPDDPFPISPAMLLTLREDPNPPSCEDFKRKDLLAYGKARWRRVQHLAESFWNRWKREYLQTLQERSKWKVERPSLRVGDVVLIRDRKTKRNRWPSGRVTSVRLGRDRLVRSVSLFSQGRTFERSITDLVLLLSPEHEK